MDKPFSFGEHAVGPQSPGKTLHILTYELGKVIEYFVKEEVYGATAYYSHANQQKEVADMISMLRYYCELRGWDYEALTKYGEEAYLERMEDIRRHGIQGNENGRD